MGNEYTVLIFTKKLEYKRVGGFKTLKEALKEMEHQKKLGIKSIRLEWRP